MSQWPAFVRTHTITVAGVPHIITLTPAEMMEEGPHRALARRKEELINGL